MQTSAQEIKPNPLHTLVQTLISLEKHDVIEILINDPNIDPSEEDNWLLKECTKKNFIKLVILLLTKEKVDPTVNNYYVLKTAANCGYLELVKLFMADARFKEGPNMSLALVWAAISGKKEVVEYLLTDKRIDVNINNGAALRRAQLAGCHGIVKLLEPLTTTTFSQKYHTKQQLNELKKMDTYLQKMDTNANLTKSESEFPIKNIPKKLDNSNIPGKISKVGEFGKVGEFYKIGLHVNTFNEQVEVQKNSKTDDFKKSMKLSIFNTLLKTHRVKSINYEDDHVILKLVESSSIDFNLEMGKINIVMHDHNIQSIVFDDPIVIKVTKN